MVVYSDSDNFYGPSYRWIILLCCTLAYGVSFLVRWSYTGLAPYISQDLYLDKAELGLLGGAFFYSYALAQIPWGWMADRLGGRYIVGLGVFLSALGLLGFSTSESLAETVVWRVLLGIMAATAFVPIASVLAHWFGENERGVVNGIYYGIGGGVGQGVAFLLMPFFSLYLLKDSSFLMPGWRGSIELVAALVLLMGLFCIAFLRSYPRPEVDQSFDNSDDFMHTTLSVSVGETVRDPVLWLLGAYFSLSLIALRLVPAWISLFAADWFRVSEHYDIDAATIAGGTVGTFFVIGHVIGSPILGKLSDWLRHCELPRIFVPTISLGISGVCVSAFLYEALSLWMLGMVALLLGILLHGFPIMNALVAERWGVVMTGRILGGINMFGQLTGAVTLSISGYVGIAFANDLQEGPLEEYKGIWYGVIGCCFLGALCGSLAHYFTSRQQQ